MTFKVGDRVRIDVVDGLDPSVRWLEGKTATVVNTLTNYLDVKVDGENFNRFMSPHRVSLIATRDFVAELQALVNDARAAGYTVKAKITETKETVL